MSLTHIQISNAKPKDKAYKIADADALYLVVRPSGAKVWRMNYRYLDRQKTLYFGSWPDVGIASARELRDAARKKLLAGLDPAAEKKVERITQKIAQDNTFKTIAEEWLEKMEREERAPVTLRKIRWLLDIADPMIGSRPISKLTAQEILAVLRKVEANGRYESARRMRSVISRASPRRSASKAPSESPRAAHGVPESAPKDTTSNPPEKQTSVLPVVLSCAGAVIVAAILFVFLCWLKSGLQPDAWAVLLNRHWPAMAGVPVSALLAFGVMLLARALGGPGSLEAFGMRAEGMAASTLLWIITFMLSVLAIRVLW